MEDVGNTLARRVEFARPGTGGDALVSGGMFGQVLSAAAAAAEQFESLVQPANTPRPMGTKTPSPKRRAKVKAARKQALKTGKAGR